MMMTVLPLLLGSFVEAVESIVCSALIATNRRLNHGGYKLHVSSISWFDSRFGPPPAGTSPIGSASSSWVRPRLHFFVSVLRLVVISGLLVSGGPGAVGHTVPCVAGNLWAS